MPQGCSSRSTSSPRSKATDQHWQVCTPKLLQLSVVVGFGAGGVYPQVTAEACHADPGSLVALCACWVDRAPEVLPSPVRLWGPVGVGRYGWRCNACDFKGCRWLSLLSVPLSKSSAGLLVVDTRSPFSILLSVVTSNCSDQHNLPRLLS